MGIKVIATRQGLYGHFREPGDEFEIADEQAFSDSWMEKLDKNGRPIPNKNTPRPAATAHSTGHAPALGRDQKLTPQGGDLT